MITEPFGLVGHLQKVDSRMDFVPVLDLLVIALLFSLLFTRFVVVPGVRVDLPVSSMTMTHSQLPVAVLTIGNNGMMFFNGSLFEAASIDEGFQRYFEEHGERESVLLIKAESSMDLQTFLELCKRANDAGFVQIQLAGQKDVIRDQVLPQEDLKPSGVKVPFN
jgi:biopolymer transport protein ExbD